MTSHSNSVENPHSYGVGTPGEIFRGLVEKTTDSFPFLVWTMDRFLSRGVVLVFHYQGKQYGIQSLPENKDKSEIAVFPKFPFVTRSGDGLGPGFISGKVDTGESDKSAILREIVEEISAILKDGQVELNDITEKTAALKRFLEFTFYVKLLQSEASLAPVLVLQWNDLLFRGVFYLMRFDVQLDEHTFTRLKTVLIEHDDENARASSRAIHSTNTFVGRSFPYCLPNELL